MQRLAVPILTVLLALGCAGGDPDSLDALRMPAGASGDGGGPAAERQAFFGDLHVHTKYSCDAFVFAARAGPDEACEFARGNPIEHPAGLKLKLHRPLQRAASD